MASFAACSVGFGLGSAPVRSYSAADQSSLFIPFWGPRRTSHVYHRSRSIRYVTTGRMRNKGGFHSPPRVPDLLQEQVRAIQLLGNFTQRKMSKRTTVQELVDLVGELPPSKEVAQQWKLRLEQKQSGKKGKDIASSYHRDVAIQKIKIPNRTEAVGRCFILLGCLERRYRLEQVPSSRVLRELKNKIGSYPCNGFETHHYKEALVLLQKERRAKERKPPRVPLDNDEDMLTAKMLLGAFAVNGSVGGKTERLKAIIGTVPRNRNVARSWKKVIAATIRKKKRKERVSRRQRQIELKRTTRLLRKQRRALEQTIAIQAVDSSSHIHLDHSSNLAQRLLVAAPESMPPLRQTIAGLDTPANVKDRRRSKLQHVLDAFAKLFLG